MQLSHYCLLELQHSLSIGQGVAVQELEDLEDQVADPLEVELGALVIMMMLVQEEQEVILRRISQEFLEMTTPFMLKFLTPPFFVMVRLREATMLMLKQNAKFFTFVAAMAMVVLLNTAFSVPMEPCLTNNILFVIGGSMLIVPLLSSFMLLMTK